MIKSQNDLEEKITPLEQELSNYKDRCGFLETQNQKLIEEIKKKNDELSEMKKQLEYEVNKCSQLNSTNEKTDKKIQELESEIEKFKQEILDKDETIKMNQFNEDLNQNRMETLEKQIEEEQNTNKQLTTDMETLRQSINETRLSLNVSYRDLTSSNQKIQELNNTIQSLNQQITKIKSEKENETRKLNETTQLLNQQITKITSEKDNEIRKLNETITDKDYEISKLKKNVDSRDEEILMYKDKCKQLESLNEESENKLKQSINQHEFNINKLNKEHEENIKKTIKLWEQNQKRQKEENIKNYKPVQSNHYEKIQYVRPKEYYTKSSFQNYTESTIEISSTTTLLTEGWKLINKFKQGNYVLVSFLGDCSTGKTHLMNQLFATNVPEIPTNEIKFITPKDMNNVLLIDNPGLRRPYKSLKLKYSEWEECKRRDFIIKAISIYLSTILIYVVNEFTSDIQKELNTLKSMFVDAPNIEQRTLFIIINKPFITTQEEYQHFMDSYITTHENEDLIKKMPTLVKEYVHKDAADSESFFSEDKANRNVLYLLYCPYLLQKYQNSNEYPHEKIKSFIITAPQQKLNSLTSELQTIFGKIGESIYNLQNKAVNVSSNLIKFDSELKKSDEQMFPNIPNKKEIVTDKIDMQSIQIAHEDLYYWKYFHAIKPAFSYYINDQNKLVIDIECSGLTKINMKKSGPTNDYYVFELGGKKVVNFADIVYSYKHWTNRLEEDVQLVIKIPSGIGKIKKNNQEKPTYQHGILSFKYEIEPEEELSD